MDVLQQLQTNKAIKQYLLALAKASIGRELGLSVDEPKAIDSPLLKTKVGVFVTLKTNGELRGCVGCLQGEHELSNAVSYYAKQAAFHDPRFSPLITAEFEKMNIELSILSPLEPIKAKNRRELEACVQAGLDGLYLIRGVNRATFLPKVWEDIPDFDTFIDHLLYKAGLDIEPWYPDATWFRYQALDIR